MKSRSQPDRPWLSVAMPVHNGERWLGHTFDSLVQQDCSGIEFIILDSSGSDTCAKIVAGFETRLDIRYERDPRMTSWPAKTNLAVERANAEHVAMLHQDDLWLPNRTAQVREAIAAFPEAALLLNPSYIIDQDGRRIGLWRCPLRIEQILQASDVAERLLVQNFVAIPAPVINRRAWLDCGGMDSALWYTADWDLYLKLLRHGPAAYLRAPSTAFRVHGSSLTIAGSRNSEDFAAQMKTVIARHIDLVPATSRARVQRRADASIAVNCQLAQAASGRAGALIKAIMAVLLLGPRQALCYLRDSRLLERALPRLRARLAGSL